MQKFNQEQLVFIVDTILTAALDRIESTLPTSVHSVDNIFAKIYNSVAMETAGMALAVLYAQLTVDGLGIYDALVCADNFETACKLLFDSSWEDDGKKVKQAMKKNSQYLIENVLPNYPNTKKHAEAFVNNVFKKYLQEEYTCYKCERPIMFEDSGVSHHLDENGNIDYDTDADHVAYTN